MVDALEKHLNVSVPLGGTHGELWPLLGAARCLRLLRAMMTLKDSNMNDAIGVLARAHYETWTAAMFVCHGRQDAVDELAADFMHHFIDLTSFLKIELPEQTPDVLRRAEPKPLSMYRLASRLEESLSHNHPLKGYALPAYRHLFAGESLFSSHGRVGSFLQHQNAADDAIAVKLEGRISPDQLDRVWEAAALTCCLEIDALTSIGRGVEELIQLVDDIGLPAYPTR